MPPLSTTGLLDFLFLTGSQAEPILSEFSSLPSDEKRSARPQTATSPTVIITPIRTTQVTQILALTHVLGATFSIRSGGHLQNPGFNSNDGGVVISFCKGDFTQLVLSEDKKTVDIGVGLRWVDVYEKLDEHGLNVAGGREPRVGVAGLLLGGGLSYQCNEVGVGCMGVVDYERLQNTAFLSALMTYHTLIEGNNKTSLIYHTVNDRTFVTFTYTGPVEDGHPNIFKPFQHIPYMRYLVPSARRTVSEMTKGVADVLESKKMFHETRPTTTLPDLEVYHVAEQARLEAIASLADVDRADLTMVFQPMSSLSVKVAHDRGGNPFGLECVGHQIFLILADYTNPADASRIQAAMHRVVDTVEETAKKKGSYLPFEYANYAAPDQDPLASYGEENLSTLREIAEKYDPEGVFQVLQNLPGPG
ncbi:hypothetical protein BDW75DRAFT_233559 [Aspergillus navahoensis]